MIADSASGMHARLNARSHPTHARAHWLRGAVASVESSARRLLRRGLAAVTANGRRYAQPQSAPVVGILLDGNEEEYVTEARTAGLMPNWWTVRPS